MTTILNPQARNAAWGALPATAVRRAGDFLHISGRVAPEHEGVRAQTRAIFEQFAELLKPHGAGLAHLVEIVSFHSDPRDIDAVFEAAAEVLREEDGYPAWTSAGFLGADARGADVMIRGTAYLGQKETFRPGGEAWPTGLAMSGAVKAGDIVYISGQTAVQEDGSVELPVNHVNQARTAYDKMLGLVSEAGGTVDDVLDFTSFHQDIRGAVATIEEVYNPEIMKMIDTDLAAATSHLGSTGLRVPGTVGTYSAIADLGGGRRVGSTPGLIWWKGVYPIAGAAKKDRGHLVAVAGQVGSAPDGSIVFDGDVAGQVRFILESIRETLAGLGLTMTDIVDMHSFHKDPRWVPVVAEVARDFFDADNPPAWTYAAVPGLWFEGYQHEIAAIAYAP